MFIFLALGAIIGAFSVVFVLQNTTPISVNFLSSEIEGSLAIILTLTFVGGVLMTALFSIPGLISDWVESNRLRKRINSLESELAEAKKREEEAKEAALRHSRAPVYGDEQSGSGLLKKV